MDERKVVKLAGTMAPNLVAYWVDLMDARRVASMAANLAV